MCTVLVSVSPGSARPLLLLGTRDEFVDRAWDPPAAWWPQQRGLVGGRDREAGGTWLAVDPVRRRISVVLNRWDDVPEPPGSWATRGVLPLAAALGDGPSDEVMRRARAFNLLTASPEGAWWIRWDGHTLTRSDVPPGVHMLTSVDLDEPAEPRVATWLDAFREAKLPEPDGADRPGAGWEPWLEVLRESASCFPGDDEHAIVRRRVESGRLYGTLALSAVSLSSTGLLFDFAGLPVPGVLPTGLPWTRAADGE